ncbi:MAG: XTP/dITP diphosphatase [Clostridium sp.]|uniref:XTP/dITP diphosphatase n=1 Tax=Clostridium sp. TaxID=1506 RepID=UPI002A8F608A|nr:XTP/dITP diphosphatase [Clostridium sp.]MDY5099640.1 XTP/dITP diphosphatase [Clostridium sp.]
MKKLIVASNNQHKIQEIKEILKDVSIEVVSLKDEGIFIEVEEDGMTFKENAYKKAKEIYDYLKTKGYENFIVMSDDSGITVDALNGEPGVYSARYAGEPSDSAKNNEKLLANLKDVPWEKRGGSFVCHISLIDDRGISYDAEGIVRGIVTKELRGKDGFGYDPLFYIEKYKKTFGEIQSDEKNKISHRSIALGKVRDIIKNMK